MCNEQKITDLINYSGFPFQTKVAEIIRNLGKSTGLSVISEEHHWKNIDSQEEGFIDIVASNYAEVLRFVIECKRKDESWLYLIPSNYKRKSTNRLLWGAKNKTKKAIDYANFITSDGLYETNQCIVQSKNNKTNALFEKICSDLLASVEMLANQDLQVEIRDREYRVYFPLIITTAKLVAVEYDQNNLDIINGKFPKPILGEQIKEVPIIKFRKSFSTSIEYLNKVDSLDQAHQYSQRTVFVVNSEHIKEFFKLLNSFSLFVDYSGEPPWKYLYEIRTFFDSGFSGIENH
jgi:hypothetical protein